MNILPLRGLRWTAMAAVLIAFSACGSSASAPPPAPAPVTPATALVQTYYDAETKVYPFESGLVLRDSAGLPTDIRAELWTTWHAPEQGNTKHFEKTYKNGNWDRSFYWREWNTDTTLRFDWEDQ